MLLGVHYERIAQVAARHRGGELERGDVRRRLRPAPLQLAAAGGREHGRPLLDVIPAQCTVSRVSVGGCRAVSSAVGRAQRGARCGARCELARADACASRACWRSDCQAGRRREK